MPNWNWSSVEMRASSGASWTWWGNSPGGEGGEEGPHAADELVAGLRVGPGPGDLQGDEPQDVGEQGVDGADHGLVGEARGPQDTVDRFAQAQAVGAKAGPLQREGDHGGVGEQVGADRAGEGGELLGPVAGGVGVQVQAGPMRDQHRFNMKAWLLWTAGFLAFPIAGWLAQTLTGRVDDAGSALVGGLVVGAVIGAGQWLVARRLLDARTWIPATAVAMGIGLLVGAWAVGYGTSLGELALMGAITGIPLGAAQAYLLRGRVASAWVWGGRPCRCCGRSAGR
jgi:hypothetical protein